MINNDQSTLLLYCCEDVKSHRSGGDTVPLNRMNDVVPSILFNYERPTISNVRSKTLFNPVFNYIATSRSFF